MRIMRANLSRERTQASPAQNTSLSVGARILQLREHLGLKRTQLAARIGISDGGLRHLEVSPTATPSFEVGLRIADELKVDPWFLLTGKGATSIADAATDIVLPAITVAQLASRLQEVDAMICSLRQVAEDMARGSVALAEVVDSQSHAHAARPNESSRQRKRAS